MEMFTVPIMSPPVPTMSTASLPVSNFSEFASMVSTKPASSSTVSPLLRSAIRKLETSSSGAIPDMISDKAQELCSRERSRLALKSPRIETQFVCDGIWSAYY